MKASVEEEKASVATLMKQRETELAGIEGNIDSAQSDADYYAAEIQAQEEIIAEIRRIEAEKAAAGKQDNHYTGGVFTWPCPSSTRVTSDYGTRVSPMVLLPIIKELTSVRPEALRSWLRRMERLRLRLTAVLPVTM